MLNQIITMVGMLGAAIIGSGITVVSMILKNHYVVKQKKEKEKRALLNELCELVFKVQKFFNTAIEGVYPIHEFSFEPLQDMRDRIMAIIIMDFEEELFETMHKYFGCTRELEYSIEAFHSLIIENPSLDASLITSKREENVNMYKTLLSNSAVFLKEIKKHSTKL